MGDMFLTELKTVNIRPGWDRVIEPFKAYSARVETIIMVPSGFEFDGDSVPRFLPISHAILKGRARKSACIHDWLYRTGYFSKHISDLIFLDFMKLEGVARRHRWPIFTGVYAGGYLSWRKHRKT